MAWLGTTAVHLLTSQAQVDVHLLTAQAHVDVHLLTAQTQVAGHLQTAQAQVACMDQIRDVVNLLKYLSAGLHHLNICLA